MSEAKIEIRIGEVSFSGEGSADWLAAQLDKMLERASDLAKLGAVANTSTGGAPTHQPADFSNATEIASRPLATFLKEKNAQKNQPDKFLAAAIWLESKGQTRLKTADVSSALKSANQTKLANPSDCLNKNVSKGYCEKDGKEFFVTQQGKDAMGIQS